MKSMISNLSGRHERCPRCWPRVCLNEFHSRRSQPHTLSPHEPHKHHMFVAHQPPTPVRYSIYTSRLHLTFNFVFGQVHRGAVGEDVGDGADPPVHQRRGDWVHRHDCDLWQPPAPWSYSDVYREDPNFPPRSPREQRNESMDGGKGARWETVDSAAWKPKFCFWSTTSEKEQNRMSFTSL